MSDSLLQEIHKVMVKHVICVFSSVNMRNEPESAIVGFSTNDDLQLLIGTSNRTRKYANLQTNQHVAVVIGDQESEIQYEGIARVVEKEESDKMLDGHFAKVAGASKYRNDPNQVYVLITPTWIRLTIHDHENRIEEVRFA